MEAFVLKTFNRILFLGSAWCSRFMPIELKSSSMAAIGVHFGYTCGCVAIFKVRSAPFNSADPPGHFVFLLLIDKKVRGFT